MKSGYCNVIKGEMAFNHKNIVSYTVKLSRRAKTVRLAVSAERGLEVIVPENYPIDQVEFLLRRKEKWILEKIRALEDNVQKVKFGDNLSVLRYLGQEYPVVTLYDAGSPIRVVLEQGKAMVTLTEERPELLKEVLEAWYRWAARELFTRRVEFYAEKMGVSYEKIFIKKLKSRWGSCSVRKNLNFNLCVVMAPLEVIDYIVIHELAHLKEMNHSRQFWGIVETYCPEFQKHKEWLKKHGSELNLF